MQLCKVNVHYATTERHDGDKDLRVPRQYLRLVLLP